MKKFLILICLTALWVHSFYFNPAKRMKKQVPNDWSAEEDYALASSLFENVKNTADDAESGGDNIGGRIGEGMVTGCVDTIYWDSLGPVHYKITVDFGADNCVGKDGHARRGKFIFEFTGLYS